MQFTQIPQQYAPLGGELRYAVKQAENGNIDIRIVDAAAGVADTAAAGTGTGIAGANEADAPAAGKTEAGATVAARIGTEAAIRVGTATAGKTASGAGTAGSVGNTNATPDGYADAAQNGYTDAAQDDYADATPAGKTDAAPDSNAVATPDDSADATPDGYADVTPDGNADAAQNGYTDATPAGKTDATPNGNADAAPDSNADATPDGYADAAQDGYADAAQDDSADAAQDGYADGNRTAGKAKATGAVHSTGPVGDGSVLLGAKRFAAVTAAEFDIAPYLRRRVRFVPATGGTGFHPAAGRTVTVLVEAAATDGNAEAVSPARTFRPGAETAEAPCLLTSMPLSRLIPEGACDELTLLTEGPCTVTVTALTGDTASAESYRAAEAGLQVFRLDLRDFPDAESLTVDAGACGTVVYTVIPARQEAVRLAWRSRAGSVEHYSFPVVQTTVVRSVRQQAYGPDGRTPATAETDRETVLVSAYEGREVLEALAELTAAPEVWIVRGDTYTPVDIATEEAVVQRHGTLSCLEIAVRPKRKTRTSWN